MVSFHNFGIKISFALLFGLVPYRIFGLLGVSIKLKLVFGFICLFVFFFVLDEIIPVLLNSFFLQTFFYFCLQIENYLYSVHLITALIFAFGIPFQVFMLASYSLDPYFWYGLILLLFNLYFRWKWIFLNPEFEGSIYKTLDNATPEVEKNFAWDFIVINMSTISKGLFRTSVENQLGASMSHRPLPFIAKRYIFTRLTQSLKGKSEVIAATAIVTGVGTVGYTEYNNDRRHQEILAMSKEANRFKLLDIKEESMSSIPKPGSSSDKEFVPCCVEPTYFSSFFYTMKRFFNLF